MARKLILVRHAQTPTNAEQRYVSSYDPTLNAEGQQQAELLAEALGEQTISRVYCSPMRRALRTANLIIEAAWQDDPPPLEVDARLEELGFGCFENKTKEQIEAEGMRDVFEAWRQGVPPQFPRGAETFESAGRRAKEFYLECILKSTSSLLVVGHSHQLRILIAVNILDIAPLYHRRLKLDNGRMVVVEWELGAPRLVGINLDCLPPS